MEKKLPFHSDTELDKLIDLLDHPEQLRMRINYLKNSGHALSDEIDGFIAFYEANEGHTKTIKEKLALEEKKLLDQLPSKKTNWTSIKWAASLLIIIGSSLFIYLYQQSNNTLSTPYEEIGLPNYMGENPSSKIDWKKIMVYYKTNQYQKITSIQNSSNNDTLTYFQGVSEFRLKQYDKSIQRFNSINKKSAFYNKSLYFKAFGYHKLKKINQFEQTLSEIKLENNDPAFNEKVEELRRM
jgi:uncharacterized protein YhbP (UPF0306 family)